IDQNAFDTERKVVEEERRLGLNRPYGDVPEKLLPQVLTVHPYRWLPIGNIAHLRASSVQNLRDFWTRYYVPNNAALVIAGAVKHDEAQKLAKRYFGWIPRYRDPPRVTVREPDLEAARTITIKTDNAPTPLLAVVFRTVPQGHDDYLPLQMLGQILGGGKSSRLYRRIVAEDQSAVIAAAAAFSLEQDGLIGAGAALAPLGGDSKKVLATINAEIERIRTEPVSDEELQKARNQMLESFVTENLTVASKASALGSAAVLEGDPAKVNTRIEHIRAVTPAALLALAQKYMDPKRSITITIERNLLGTLLGKKRSAEEDAPISAQAEMETPPPGRAGLTRPADLPTTAPLAPPAEVRVTPEFESRTLPNGMKVIVVHNSESPFVTMQLGFTTGAWSESKPGTAAMAMSMLTHGTKKRSEGEMARELETHAISLNGSAGSDSANVSASCLTEQVDRAAALLAEAVRTPTFPEDEFEKLRKQVRTGLVISSAEPSYIADRELRGRLYGDHPYSRTATGEIADLDALEADDLAPWHAQYIRPDLATLIFAGDIEGSAAMKLAQEHFGDWRGEGPRPEPKLPALPQPAPTQIYLVDRPGVQAQIRVAQRGILRSDPGYFVSRVVGGYFGGAFSSRLNETIRVKLGLTYGARGGWSTERFAGKFEVSTFTKIDSTGQTVRAIFDELKRAQDEPPSDEELAKTKSYIIGSFPADRETPQQVASDRWLIESQGLPNDYFEQLLRGVAQTTQDACATLAKQAIRPDQMIVVIVGPAEAIRPQLEGIAPVTVIQPGQPTSVLDAPDETPDEK
ncbi:MAG: insulinase family protein, partial [Planctomycetes bacterium]|nr:insulinase family protein [Planctomycetota bacterium]